MRRFLSFTPIAATLAAMPAIAFAHEGHGGSAVHTHPEWMVAAIAAGVAVFALRAAMRWRSGNGRD